MKILVYGFALTIALLMSVGAFAAGGTTTKKSTIVWDGTVKVKKSFTVPNGKTLEIRPGSRIQFAKGTSLMVKGTLKALGSKDNGIVFSSLNKGSSGKWHEIMLDAAGDSVMEYCTIDNATWGLHSHDTKLILSNCTISNSEVGLRFRSGPLTISKSRFTGNKIGLRSYQGIAQISESDFKDNEIGIFVREKGSGLNITRSNFTNNTAFNIRVGDFNTEDVKAAGNWWGTDEPTKTIFDARNEPDIGHVVFEPFSKERISWQ